MWMFFFCLPLFTPNYTCINMPEHIKTSSWKSEYMNNYFLCIHWVKSRIEEDVRFPGNSVYENGRQKDCAPPVLAAARSHTSAFQNPQLKPCTVSAGNSLAFVLLLRIQGHHTDMKFLTSDTDAVYCGKYLPTKKRRNMLLPSSGFKKVEADSLENKNC